MASRMVDTLYKVSIFLLFSPGKMTSPIDSRRGDLQIDRSRKAEIFPSTSVAITLGSKCPHVQPKETDQLDSNMLSFTDSVRESTILSLIEVEMGLLQSLAEGIYTFPCFLLNLNCPR